MSPEPIESFEALPAADAERIGACIAASAPAVKPAPAGLARLLATVANPWVRLLDRFASLVDLPRDLAERVLDAAQVGHGWGPGPLPGVSLVHFEGGLATAGADVGIVRLPPDTEFPLHTHLGTESIVVLEGGYVDSEGYSMNPGDSEARQPGTAHSFRAGPNGVVLAVVLREGIEVASGPGGAPVVIRA